MSFDSGRERKALEMQMRSCYAMGSPMYGALLERCIAEGDHNVVLQLLADRPREENLVTSATVLRLLAAVHRLVIDGGSPKLAAYYPSCGGDFRLADAWPEFIATIELHREIIIKALDEPIQTNEIGRAAALLGGFLFVAKRFGLPLRLIELGASAGLTLRWDHFFYKARYWSWGSTDANVRFENNFISEKLPFEPGLKVEILERLGCDLAPIDATTEEGQKRLLSFVWPDQRNRMKQLAAACEIARHVPATVEQSNAAPWLITQLRTLHPGSATVVFHSVMLQYLTSSDQKSIANTLKEAGERATAVSPLAYLSLEPQPTRPANVLLRVWPGDVEFELAHASLHGRDIQWLAKEA